MRRGFTILEILIAMAIFVIGVVSIMAVMPVGIQSSKISSEHSVASSLAESLNDSLTLAMRQYSGVAGSTAAADQVNFFHDGLSNSGAGQFILPDIETWKDTGATIGPADVVYVANGRSKPTWYPMTAVEWAAWTAAPASYAASNPPATLASFDAAYGKGGDIAALVGTENKDYPDPLSQYSFRFMCHEYKTPNDFDPDTGALASPTDNTTYACTTHPAGTGIGFYKQFEYQNGTEAEVIDRLYQFTLYVYRGWRNTPCEVVVPAFDCWQQTSDTTGTPVIYQWHDQMKHPAKIERFEFLIYAQGAQQ